MIINNCTEKNHQSMLHCSEFMYFLKTDFALMCQIVPRQIESSSPAKRPDLDCRLPSGSSVLPAETQGSTGSFVTVIRLLRPAAGRGGHKPDPRLPQGSSGLREAPHGFPRLLEAPGPGCSLICIRCCYTGDVLSLSLWEECRSNYMGGP